MNRSNRVPSFRFRLLLAGSVAVLAVAAGCGGGGSSSSPGATAPAPAATVNPISLYVVPASQGGSSPVTQPSPGTPAVNNISIPFTAVGQQVGVLVYEVGFSGTFYAQAQNCIPNALAPAVVVSPGSISGVKSFVFVVTASAAGFCDVKISDGTNGAAILVDVTTTTGTISSVGRH